MAEKKQGKAQKAAVDKDGDSKMSGGSSAAAEGLSLDSAPLAGSIKLISKDKTEFEVSKKVAWISNLVKTTCDNDASTTEIPLSVTLTSLALIVEYMNHYEGKEPEPIEKPLISNDPKVFCRNEWDAAFISQFDENGSKRQVLYDLVQDVHRMDIPSLYILVCSRVASFMKGKAIPQIKEALNKGMPAKAASEVKSSGSGSGSKAADTDKKDEKEKKKDSDMDVDQGEKKDKPAPEEGKDKKRKTAGSASGGGKEEKTGDESSAPKASGKKKKAPPSEYVCMCVCVTLYVYFRDAEFALTMPADDAEAAPPKAAAEPKTRITVTAKRSGKKGTE